MDKVFDTFLSRDPRMNVKSRVEFGVVKGASDYTVQEIKCNSASPSSVNFSWTPPSENTFICRKALIKSTMTFTCALSGLTVANGIADNAVVFNPAANTIAGACMQSFPFHRCATNVQTTINNSQIDVDMPSYLPAMLQLIDQEDLREFSTQCPILMDRFLNYSDAIASDSSPFSGYNQSSFKSQILGRGAFPIKITAVNNSAGGGNAASLRKIADNDTITVTFTVDTVEPILLPPWCNSKYGEESADAFLGVNRLNLRYAMSSQANRVLSSALPSAVGVVTTLTDVSNETSLLIQYMNSDATVLVPERCIYNFWQIYNYSNLISGTIATGASQQTFSNLQLSEVPSLIVLYARLPVADATAKTSDFFYPLDTLSVSFNNRVSLLSQFSVSDLYNMSKRNGLKNVDFFQFLGKAQQYSASVVSLATAQAAYDNLALAGSIVVIDPARDLSISSPYISDASTGQFNFSWRANVNNNTGAASKCELVTLLFNSRMLLCASGNSEIIQPALNQEQVAKTIDSGRVGAKYPNEEMIGGKMMAPMVNRSVGGSRSGGASRSGGKSRLDALLM